MADVFTRTKRSDVMSRIRSRGNRDTELRMIQLFREHQITGWRRNTRVFGRPDFVFPRPKIAVFVDGCFWHRPEFRPGGVYARIGSMRSLRSSLISNRKQPSLPVCIANQ